MCTRSIAMESNWEPRSPLWGGFSGNGKFILRLWTPQPKMTTSDWAALIPEIKAAVDDAYGDDPLPRPKVWHDNERFLLQPDVYAANGLHLFRFPPNSGDLNPIETVWAWLRKDWPSGRSRALLRDGT